jgi:NhaP-type Na+/H+ or K+/H+ antiporter
MACLLGVLSGIALLIWDLFHRNFTHKALSFDSAAFFTYMLPPIIFYGGLAIKRKLFVSNLVSILAFGVLGTFISFTLIGVFLYALALLPNVLSVSDCFSLAAIFAATDSVAVLQVCCLAACMLLLTWSMRNFAGGTPAQHAGRRRLLVMILYMHQADLCSSPIGFGSLLILSAIQVLRPESHPALYSIVLGEGVLNDATSVALLRSVKPSDADAALTPGLLLSMFTFFCYVFAASFALGAASGLVIAAAMKHLGPFSQPQEVALVGALAFLSYLSAEILGLSGILALFFCGMAVSHYALQHVNPRSRAALLNAFATLSYLLEGFIFLYVGRDALDPVKWSNASFFQTLFLVVVIAALVATSRAIFVFPCAPPCQPALHQLLWCAW